jgi:uncharacterized protein (DUF305 family)
MHRVILAIAFSAALATAATSQTVGSGQNSPATQAYLQAMGDMNDKMKDMEPTGDPSMDFVMTMTPHHQAAVEMAQTYLKYGKDPTLTRMAKNIISSQKKEIKEMEAWQKKHSK